MDRILAGLSYLRCSPHHLLLAAYLIACAAFFLFVALPVAEGFTEFQFYADSTTYIELVGTMGDIDFLRQGVAVNANFLGPFLILSALQTHELIFLLHVAILIAALVLIQTNYELDRTRLAVLLIVSPLLFSSMMLVNKEILAMLCAALMLAYAANRQIVFLLAAAVAGMLVRWQMTVFVAVAALFLFFPSNTRTRVTLLGGLVILLTASLFVFRSEYQALEDKAFQGIEAYAGSGVFVELNSLQRDLGYWVVAIPKILHLSFGMLLRPDKLGSSDDVYNDGFVFGQAAVFLMLTLYMFYRGKARIDSDAVFLGLIYLIIFGATPIYAHRYLFPVYIFFAVAACRSGQRPLHAPVELRYT